MQFKHLSLMAFVGYVAAQETNNTLNATLSENPDLSNLTALLNSAPTLLQALASAENITILAPSNQAFEELANSTLDMADPELFSALLSYHIINGTYTADDITNSSAFIPTLLVNSTYSNVTGGQVVEAVRIGNDTTFYSGLLQNATVTQGDVNFTGGVLHVIDSVLTLPWTVTDTALAADLGALRGALNRTDLIEAVNETPDITIFAPSNEAFQAIGSALEDISDEDLASILAYHVINGTIGYSSDLENGTSLQTVNGANLTISIDANGTVFVNAAQVITPNVLVANGVVHIIDNVLSPNATEGPEPSATEGAPAFTGASSVSEVPFTSGQPTPTTEINPSSEGPGPASTAVSSSTGAAVPMRTGAAAAAALFGVPAAVLMGY